MTTLTTAIQQAIEALEKGDVLCEIKAAHILRQAMEAAKESLARSGLTAIRLAREGDQQAAETLRAQQDRIAELESQLEAIGAGGVEPLRKTDTAARGTDAQIIKERELCAYAFAGAVADGLSGGTGPDTQESEWLRPAFEAGQEIAQLRADIYKLRKRECLHQIAGPAPLNKATAEHALRRILHIVQRYLPPDGTSIDKAMNEIIAVVDPWPVAEGDAGMYPQLPDPFMTSHEEAGCCYPDTFSADQMRAYAAATCAARAATTASAPVVLP